MANFKPHSNQISLTLLCAFVDVVDWQPGLKPKPIVKTLNNEYFLTENQDN